MMWGPTLLSTSPAHQDLNVALDSSIILTFSEALDPSSVSSHSVRLFGPVAEIGTTITTNGDTVTIIPDVPFEYSSNYQIELAASITDLNGNFTPSQEVFWFRTVDPDLDPPVVTWISPAADSQDVSNSLILQARFSEALDASTVNSQSVTVFDGYEDVPGVVSLVGEDLIQFSPTDNWAYSTVHAVQLSTDIQDKAGNALSEDFSWSFTTRAWAPNYCNSYANNVNYMWLGAVEVNGFSHHSPGKPGSGYSDHTGTVFDLSSSVNSVTITPAYSSSNYPVHFKVFIDWDADGNFGIDELAWEGQSSGNAVVGSFTVPVEASVGETRMRVSMQYSNNNFDSCSVLSYGEVEDYRVNVPQAGPDTINPSVESVFPANQEYGVDVDANIEVYFSEPIDVTTIALSSFQVTNGQSTISKTLAYNSAPDGSTQKITINPISTLPYGSQIEVTVSPEMSDMSGNLLDQPFVWTFDTQAEVINYEVSGWASHTSAYIPNLEVSISGDLVSTSTMADAQGQFSFDAIPAGNYMLEFYTSEYELTPSSHSITVTDSNLDVGWIVLEEVVPPVLNGDFEAETPLEGFTVYTTPNGQMTAEVETFDVDGDSVSSKAAKLRPGSLLGETPAGGGISQVLNLSYGQLSGTIDVASINTHNFYSMASGGVIEVYLNDTLMDSIDFGPINEQQIKRGVLTFDTNVSTGTYELRIEVKIAYEQAYVFNYIDDISFTGTAVQ